MRNKNNLLFLSDLLVNGPLTAEMFNILGFHESNDDNEEVIKTLYSQARTEDQIEKEKMCTDSIIEDTSEVIDTLTPHDLRVLIKSEEELSQTKDFERIFPHKEYDE